MKSSEGTSWHASEESTSWIWITSAMNMTDPEKTVYFYFWQHSMVTLCKRWKAGRGLGTMLQYG